jgi:sugar phosphate isomerase/epimerase
MRQELRAGVSYAGVLVGRPYLGEVDPTMSTAEELQLTIEWVYRVGGAHHAQQLFGAKPSIVRQIHAPIFYDFITAAVQGAGELSRTRLVLNPLLAVLALGTLRHDFMENVRLAQALRVTQLVVHPHGARRLQQSGLLSLAKAHGIRLAIEPDWRRPDACFWLWQREVVREIADTLDEGICLDTSHTLISYQSGAVGPTLCQTYDELARARRGVVAIHLSGALPDAQNEVSIYGAGRRAVPLDPRMVPPEVLGGFREFMEHLRQMRFQGQIVVELFSFPGGDSLERRKAAVWNTLNALFTGARNDGSMSLRGRPTWQKL